MPSLLSAATLFLLVSVLVVRDVAAVPMRPRQCTRVSAATPLPSASPVANATSDACTQARLDILVSLIASEDATSKINSTDPTTQTAVDAAEQGFNLTFTGIKSIAGAIFTNQSPPAASRDQVGQGITDTQTALLSINGTDAGDLNLALAKQSLGAAAVAANAVVENCK
ncbi:hypothetical protein CCMSSC00406_0008231 [Pleurotus cornucopiae]|uniref:Uncharacterized protein n=1 Tax=Pleurotus cornucopiae TaxID=5321 RepID=A0ACB7IMY3_PLECO|nr:hypothetical protein CCMSSC00406_0008231 [Pleurotus cornucopiae]